MNGRWSVKPEPANPLLAVLGITHLWWTVDPSGVRQHPHVDLGRAMDCARRQIEVPAMEAALAAVAGDPR